MLLCVVLGNNLVLQQLLLSPLLLLHSSMRGMHVFLVGVVLCGAANFHTACIDYGQPSLRPAGVRAVCTKDVLRSLQPDPFICMPCALQPIPSPGPLSASWVLTSVLLMRIASWLWLLRFLDVLDLVTRHS